jgi:heat shock protein HslJ
MRTLPLILVAAAALLAPAAVAAASGTPGAPVAPAAARSFVITALVLGDHHAAATGKLGIAGGQLSASVGCNFIGGKASLDGNTLTIADGLVMTAIGCPAAEGRLEDMLVKILGHGPFRISPNVWTGNGASIEVEEVPTALPAPGGTAPDEPIGSRPGPVLVDPLMSCPPSGAAGNGTVGSGTVGNGTVGRGGSGSGAVGPAGSAIAVPPPPPDAGGAETPPSGAPDPDPGFIGADPGIGKPVEPCYAAISDVDQANDGAGIAPKNPQAVEHASASSAASDSGLAIELLAGLAGVTLVGLLVFRRGRLHGEKAAVGAAVEPAEPGATPR